MPSDCSSYQRAAGITYYLLLRWMAGAPGVRTTEVAQHLNIPFAQAWDLMQLLLHLPFIACTDGLYEARMDIPIWGLRSVDMTGPCRRAAVLAYYLVSATLCDIGLTARQMRVLTGLSRNSLDNMLAHLCASDSHLPLYRDGLYWKLATQHWVIARSHDLQQ